MSRYYSTIETVAGALQGAKDHIEQQQKVIDNLTEENRKLRAEKPKPLRPKNPRVQFSRNKEWLRSAFLGFREGVWLAPTALIEDVGTKLLGLTVGVLLVGFFLLTWLLARPAFIIVGLLGYLEDKK